MRTSGYEHLCQLLIHAYPEPYRSDRAQEIVAVLLDADDQRSGTWTRLREIGGLLLHASRVRTRSLVTARGTVAQPPPWSLAGLMIMVVLAVVATQAWTAALIRVVNPGTMHGDGWLDPRWPVHLAWLLAGVLIWLRQAKAAWVVTLLGAVLVTMYTISVPTGIPWPGDLSVTWGGVSNPYDMMWPLTARDAAWWGLTMLALAMSGSPRKLTAALASIPRPALGRAAVAATGAMGVLALLAATDAALNSSYWFTAEHVRTTLMPTLIVVTVLVWHLGLRAHAAATVITLATLALALATTGPILLQTIAAMIAIMGGLLLLRTARNQHPQPHRADSMPTQG